MESERSKEQLQVNKQVNKDDAKGFQTSSRDNSHVYNAPGVVNNFYSPESDEPRRKEILLLPASLYSTEKPSRSAEIRRTIRAIDNSHKENTSKAKRKLMFNVVEKDKSDIGGNLSKLLSAINPYIVDISGFEEGITTLVIEDSESSEIKNVDEFVSGQFEFNAPEIACIILNGCYAENQATKLIQHIEFLIGISKDLRKEPVLTFLDEFYYRIGLGWSIDRAYRSARHKIEQFESDQTKLPFLRNAKKEKELVFINRKIEEDPSNVMHWKQKADRLKKIGRYQEADQAYAKATSLEPSNPLLTEERGDFLEQSGKHREAASVYKESSQLLKEKDYKVLWKAGKASARANLYSKAINFYEQALELEPPTPDNYLICREYGHILEKDHKYSAGIAAYKKALKYQPKYRTSRYEQRWLYQKIHSMKKWIAVQN